MNPMTKKISLFTLYHILSASFCVIVVLSNILSAKLVKVPFFFDLIVPAGLVTYPLTFLISDLVTEVFGTKKARHMVYVTLGMNGLSFAIIYLALLLPAHLDRESAAFQTVLGLSGLRIVASLTAYMISQLVDIQLYSQIKKWTGPRFLWVRNNASTCISQLVDTFLVDIIYLYLGLHMGLQEVVSIMGISYAYKAFFSFAITPLFYLCVYLVRSMDRTQSKSIRPSYESFVPES